MKLTVFRGALGFSIAAIIAWIASLALKDLGIGALLSSPPPIVVDHVEVTQGVQNDANTVPLVAHRSLAVRVYARAVGGETPTARVGVRIVSTPFNLVLGQQEAEFVVPATWTRHDASTSANLEFLPPVSVPPGNATVRVEVRPKDGGVADVWQKTFAFVPPVDLRVRHTRIDFLGKGPPSPFEVASGMADAFLRGVFPVRDDAGATLYSPGFDPVLDFDVDANGNSVDVNGNQKVDADLAEAQHLMLLLNDCRLKSIPAGQTTVEDAYHVYGWLPDSLVNGNGAAPYYGRVAWGTTNPVRAQRTMVHELGHNLGMQHALNGPTAEVGWDVGARLLNNPAGNLVEEATARLKSATLADVMDAGQITRMSWVREDTYRCLLGTCAPGLLIGSGSGLVPDAKPRVAAVSGVLAPDGGRVERLEPVFRYAWPVAPSRHRSDADHRVRLTLDDGTELTAPFDGRVEVLGEEVAGVVPVTERYGFFEVRIAVPPGRVIERLDVERSTAGAFVPLAPPVVGDPDAGAPQVTLAPLASRTLSAPTVVSWAATDANALAISVSAQLAFSPDDRTSWVPVGGNLGEVSQATVDPARLPSAAGDGVLRIHLSDGLRTTIVEHTGLTVP